MTAALLILQLFATFFVIGMFTFGGGYAMLSLIQGQVVGVHEWISQSTFTDIVAISQMTPGPIGINCATYVGYDVLVKDTGVHFLGILGSFAATLAVVLPSFIIVLALAKFYMKFSGNGTFESIMGWLRPSVVGLIGAAAAILMFDASWSGFPLLSEFDIRIVTENFPDWKSWVLFAAALIASLYFKVGPIKIILAGGVLGLILY
jgi:chromate transporter